ncbi:hypothetical protein DC498_11740 [Terrimonas sp.]|uniref:hypothetical protein n=1 Tax=Terrimonas sp. TaxID=1914338 RepID=UPI000D50EAE2|nr:hypothetical protein [Terrimonas sp.]PVD52054.1 hypothetical protein DC498_11740 [Terrimonas sp.]
MKIKFFNPDSLDKNLKATAHKSGKLGFTVDAARRLRLETNKSAAIGTNEDDASDDSLYIIIYNEVRSDAFRIAKAGQYYYINLKALFDALKINYKQESVVYDISEVTFGDDTVFKFSRRKNTKKAGIEL